MRGLAREMGDEGERCRQMAKMTLGIALKRLESEAAGGVVSLDNVRRVAEKLSMDSALLSACCGKMERDCLADFQSRRFEVLRKNYLGRIIARPLAGILDRETCGIERRHLSQFFQALRLMMGIETYTDLAARAERAASRYRDGGGCVVWPDFYEDPEVKGVYESVLVVIARSFQRFEMRCDWLLTVMNQNAKGGKHFEKAQLKALLTALFAPEHLEFFFAKGRAGFSLRWGQPPEAVFQPFLAGLERLAGAVSP
jgi:hypothetical protein